MKKIIYFLLFSIIFIPSQIVSADQDEAKEIMVGLWQSAESLGSGWDNVYRFFNDGKFIFNISSSDCATRKRSYSGTWKIEKENLVLTITEQILLIGGKLVKIPLDSINVCQYEIKGATEEKTILKKPEILTLKLGKFEKNPSNSNQWTVKFGKQQYWKLGSIETTYP